MAISQEDSKVLAAVFGEEVAEKLSGAVTEELTLGLRLNGKILSAEEQKTLRENAITQGKELGYKFNFTSSNQKSIASIKLHVFTKG